jgi:hypothetical protein
MAIGQVEIGRALTIARGKRRRKSAGSQVGDGALGGSSRLTGLAKGFETKPGGKAWEAKSVYEGVEHHVEGRSNLAYKPVTSRQVRIAGESYKNAGDHMRIKDIPDKEGRIAIKENKKTKREVKGFKLEDEIRAQLKPVADPDAIAQRERKRAARRRMRGRLGTLLSERETLG